MEYIPVYMTMFLYRVIGTFESEKEDILERRAYLIEKVVTTPEKLLGEMASSGSDSHILNR